MHQHNNHDTSTQAMTEVALGLSMAFFSLLILALFSIGLPEQQNVEAVKQNPLPLDIDEQLKLANSSGKAPSNITAGNQHQQYAFYFNGKFYDQQLNPLNNRQLLGFKATQPLILAVQDTLALAQIMALRQRINHPDLSITMLNQSWQNQLEKMP